MAQVARVQQLKLKKLVNVQSTATYLSINATALFRGSINRICTDSFCMLTEIYL